MEMTRILLLEDDTTLAGELKLFLAKQGMACDTVGDGALFFRKLGTEQYDIFILDINVPVISGIDVCRKVREDDPATPILMLTAYSAVEDKVNAFRSGADDYLVKPFHLDELLMRINALLRRRAHPQDAAKPTITIEDLVISTKDMKVTRGGKEITLTPKEYKLLELLALAHGQPVSKQTIASKVWDINFETGTNTIEVYINYLRNKIDKGQARPLVHTRPGFGYYLQ